MICVSGNSHFSQEFKPEDMNLHLPSLTAFSSHQLEFLRESKVSRKIIEQIDDETDPKPEKLALRIFLWFSLQLVRISIDTSSKQSMTCP